MRCIDPLGLLESEPSQLLRGVIPRTIHGHFQAHVLTQSHAERFAPAFLRDKDVKGGGVIAIHKAKTNNEAEQPVEDNGATN